ncbi:MAG: sodium/proton-translocating pyrophosphatase [Phycisphaerales bacterium]
MKISTDASLREMVPPAVLVIAAPIVTGTFFGVEAVTGLLAGGGAPALRFPRSPRTSSWRARRARRRTSS